MASVHIAVPQPTLAYIAKQIRAMSAGMKIAETATCDLPWLDPCLYHRASRLKGLPGAPRWPDHHFFVQPQ